MESATKKQALYIHIENQDANPRLCFEFEDFDPNYKIQPYTDTVFPTLIKEDILDDVREMELLGARLVAYLLVKHSSYDRGEFWAVRAHAYEKDGEQYIDFDQERFRENIQRRPCAFVPFKTLDLDRNMEDGILAMRAARIIVNALL
jgi:hypothetical protein